jgi:hypothetical protein
VLKKVENRAMSKISQMSILDNSDVGMSRSAGTKVRGRFSEMRRGPSHRYARDASAALEIFVRHSQKTFSTVSVKSVTLAVSRSLPIYTQLRTYRRAAITDALCQTRTRALQQRAVTPPVTKSITKRGDQCPTSHEDQD